MENKNMKRVFNARDSFAIKHFLGIILSIHYSNIYISLPRILKYKKFKCDSNLIIASTYWGGLWRKQTRHVLKNYWGPEFIV